MQSGHPNMRNIRIENLIRGLDDDEVQFLELVDAHKIHAERQQMRDEELELKDFRNRVEKLQEESVDKVGKVTATINWFYNHPNFRNPQKLQAELKTTAKSAGASVGRSTQKTLLGQGIKRKNGELPTTSKVAKITENEVEQTATNEATKDPADKTTNTTLITNKYNQGALKCIAILPGIGSYTESSDSEASTDEEEPSMCSRTDLCGRKIPKKKQCSE